MCPSRPTTVSARKSESRTDRLAGSIEHGRTGRDARTKELADRQTVWWPTRTFATSTIESVGPGGSVPIRIPKSPGR